MATSDFKPFASGGGANVTPQADYVNLAALTTGFSSGTAKSDQVNKALRQGTIGAAVLAEFIVSQTGQNAVDDGTTDALAALLVTAIEKVIGSSVTGLFGQSGPTASRPVPTFVGQPYLDTDLGQWIFAKSLSPVTWAYVSGVTA
ncbi:hypothetical protein KDW20_33645 [Burkholderia cenocepacia]|uniref:hypothetical protein n=1 Tax=Burkholderia cenocepacia TaxID=95486 RepID=UPI000F59D4B1|nr:hypothetical protein [Burkholderia cenocepacia]MBR8380726.1 hypothetical protein [Burkholderia cenocepacia]